MFRPLTRNRQQIPEAECIAILKREKRGVLSVLGDDGYPYGMPLNHYYHEEDGCLYFHGGKTGHKIDALKRHDKVSFCVYDSGWKDEGAKVPWALNISSVIVFGRMEFVEDYDEVIRISRALSYKFTDDETYIANEIAGSGKATLVLRLRPEHMTGKLVNEC